MTTLRFPGCPPIEGVGPVITAVEAPSPDAGWISARNGQWHRATVAEPTFTRDETAACGMTFRPLNVTWNGEQPPTRARFMCQRPGCAAGGAR